MAMSHEPLWDLPRALLGTRADVIRTDRHFDDRNPTSVGRQKNGRSVRRLLWGDRSANSRKTR
jgi:hypothetical protein